MASLDGTWRVERTGGLLPPFGLSKRIEGGRGWTLAAGIPLAPFRDELEPGPDGSWQGRGLLLGHEFCRFRLIPVTARTPSSV